MSFKLNLLAASILGLANCISFSSAHSLEFGGKGGASGHFGGTIYLAFGKADTIYVSDPENSRIQILTPGGDFLRSISPSQEGEFQFNRIGELATGPDGSIWVADWKTELMPRPENSPPDQQTPVHFLSACIHRFDPTGTYLGTVLIDPTPILAEKEILPAVDQNGRPAFLVRSPDYDRPLHLATDQDGNLYVLDEKRNRIYCYAPSGEFKRQFGRFGQLDRPQAIDCDRQGNIHVANGGSHHIAKFDPSGKFLFSAGEKGIQNLQFIFPYLLRITRDNRLLIADRSEFEKEFISYLPRRKVPPSEQETLEEPKGREYVVWLRRIQELGTDGRFIGKSLVRLSDERKDLKLLAINRTGTLFLLDPETSRIITESFYPIGIEKKSLHKSYRIRVEKGVHDSNLDSGIEQRIGDLEYNYLADTELIAFTQSLLLQYDFTERLRTRVESTTSYLHAYRSMSYPQEDLSLSGWTYDQLLFDDFIDGEIRLGLEIVLDQNPYEYRQLNLFLSLGGRIYDFRYDALDRSNQMHGYWHLWQHRFGAGFDWDIRRDLNVYFAMFVKNPGDFMNYRYRHWNEEGDLRARGWFRGRTTIAYGGINMVF